MASKLTCTCGKESVEVPSGITMGDISTRTNFRPVNSFVGETIWLCNDCYKKVHELALAILKIVKDENLYFLNLLNAAR